VGAASSRDLPEQSRLKTAPTIKKQLKLQSFFFSLTGHFFGRRLG
jgi:hypothetical protein